MRAALAVLFASLLFATPVLADEAVPGVRVWFHSSSADTSAKLYLREMHDGEERWVNVCVQACRVVLPRSARVRAVLEGSDVPRDFELQETGRDVEVDVRPPSRAAVAGGIVMASLGGLTTLIGLIVFGVSVGDSDESAQTLRTAGLVTTLLGGGLTIGGLVLVENRSTAPRVAQRQAGVDVRNTAKEREFPLIRSVFSWGLSF